MCRMFNCFGGEEALSALEKANKLKKTKNNQTICRSAWKRFFTKDQMQALSKSAYNLRILFSDQFCEFSQILPHLYLTGMGGLTAEKIKEYNIKAVVNVSYEVPGIDIKGVRFIRVPVEDTLKEVLTPYFDEVVDQIDDWISHQRRVVIHCLCGVSRSVTFTLAYLMKYKRESLKTAFMRVYKIRTFIKPNYSFMAQLIEYEKKLFKKTSVKMVLFKTLNGKLVSTPDLYIKVFPEKSVKDDEAKETPDTAFSATASLQTLFP